MREGKTILMGGLARLDYVRGPPLYFAVFGSTTVDIHYTSLDGADRMLGTKLGTFLTPPILFSEEELKKEMERADEYTKKLYKFLPKSGQPPQATETESVTKDSEDDANDVDVDVDDDDIDDGIDAESRYDLELHRDGKINDVVESVQENYPSEYDEGKTLIDMLNEQRPVPLPPEYEETTFTFEQGGEDFDCAFTDFVYPGVGWISATGKSQEKLVFRASGFSKPFIREPIMPLESDRTHRKTRGYHKHGKLSNYQYSCEYEKE